ncbi:MAG: DUF4384 domain-containing protein [Bacteroides sp.]|nr:DUF4384 domain-containing protein [Bacteroides sp.]
MRQNNLIKWVLLLLLVAAAPLHAQKVVKVKDAVGRWQVGGNVTTIEAEERALMEAKKEALRKAGVVENVWSVFGQITEEHGSEFHEAYSQTSGIAIGGMLLVTKKEVKPVWDQRTETITVQVTIDAEVKKDDEEDKTYAMEVTGIKTLYEKASELSFKLKVFGADSYLKFFWFDNEGGKIIFPNDYEPSFLLKAGKTYNFPIIPDDGRVPVSYLTADKSERINLMIVATKENIPFVGEVTYENLLKWIYSIPNSKRCTFHEMAIVK